MFCRPLTINLHSFLKGDRFNHVQASQDPGDYRFLLHNRFPCFTRSTIFRGSLPSWWQKSFDPIHLGLDLQGGIHLVLGVEADKAVESRLDSIADETESMLKEKDIIFKKVRRVGDESVGITVYDEVAGTEIESFFEKNFPAWK